MPAEPPANPTISRCRGGFLFSPTAGAPSCNYRGLATMQSMLSLAKRVAIRAALLILAPALVVCSGDKSTGTENPPGSISDLVVSAIASTSATLTFTQVDDGTGQ